MSYLTLPESINMLLDAHEPESDATDQQLAAVRAATPSGDYFYADQCGRLRPFPEPAHSSDSRRR